MIVFFSYTNTIWYDDLRRFCYVIIVVDNENKKTTETLGHLVKSTTLFWVEIWALIAPVLITSNKLRMDIFNKRKSPLMIDASSRGCCIFEKKHRAWEDFFPDTDIIEIITWSDHVDSTLIVHLQLMSDHKKCYFYFFSLHTYIYELRMKTKEMIEMKIWLNNNVVFIARHYSDNVYACAELNEVH